MHPGDPEAVTGDADVAGQALVPGREQRLERAARTDGDLPLVGLDEVVELDQVDVVDAHPLERPLEFGPRPVTRALARLGREEDLVAVVGEPRLQPILGRAVSRGRVDVVDAPLVRRGRGSRRPVPGSCRRAQRRRRSPGSSDVRWFRSRPGEASCRSCSMCSASAADADPTGPVRQTDPHDRRRRRPAQRLRQPGLPRPRRRHPDRAGADGLDRPQPAGLGGVAGAGRAGSSRRRRASSTRSRTRSA